MPIYPLPPGCVFREDFYSIDTVTSNGGIITGTPTINKGIVVLTANTQKITYSLLLSRSLTNTIILNVNLKDVTNSSWLLRKGDSSTPAILLLVSGGVLYAYCNSVSTNVGYCSIATGKQSIIISFNGVGATNSDKMKFYFNGVLQSLTFGGTIPTELSWQTSGVLGFFGSGISTSGAAGNKIIHSALFNYIFTQADITCYHNMLQGIK